MMAVICETSQTEDLKHTQSRFRFLLSLSSLFLSSETKYRRLSLVSSRKEAKQNKKKAKLEIMYGTCDEQLWKLYIHRCTYARVRE